MLNLGTANFDTIASAELSVVFEDGPVSQG
jgi:hypothetical protein